MSLVNPIIWQVGEEIKSILSSLPTVFGGTSPMFSNTTHGLIDPEKQSADKFPLASIVLPQNGSFKSTNGMSVDYSEVKLPVYAYFHEDNLSEATKLIYRFIQLFAQAIEEMNYNWRRETVTVIPEQFVMDNGLKSGGNDKNNAEIHPPFHGVKLILNVRINESAL